MKPKETFKEMLTLCYEEDFPELHKELISLESETKKIRDSYKYEKAMEEIFNLIPLFSEDFPQEIMLQLEKLYEDCIEE
jgi:hypothetical protein